MLALSPLSVLRCCTTRRLLAPPLASRCLSTTPTAAVDTMGFVTVATCNLNQFALDFNGNLERICESIRQAKAAGAKYRVGPELETSGYGCEDHFCELDTINHSWESIAHILDSGLSDGILLDIGSPVLHKGVRYNCRVFIADRKVLLVRPKLYMADDGNYRESRYFTPWSHHRLDLLEPFPLPRVVRDVTGQESAPLGIAVLQCLDATLASETCEELFTPRSPHIEFGLNGVDIISNGSGSHHQLRKLHQRVDLIRSATAKSGGVYLYANQQGCDGSRLYYDGCAMVCVNGQTVAQASQFSLRDVEVVTATVDLADVRSYRAAIVSRGNQATAGLRTPHVPVPMALSADRLEVVPTPPSPVHYHHAFEEIALGPSCWLWDYLRRSGASGFFLPLSGGADSASVATIVYCMCRSVVVACQRGDEKVLADVRRICDKPTDSDYVPATPQEFMNVVMHTCFMGTTNSSAATRRRAKDLADSFGAYHVDANVDIAVTAMVKLFTTLTGLVPRFSKHGGTTAENLALQNIQARLRMVLAYFMGSLLPQVRSNKGFLLVLGSANVDEGLRGYMTKYDCSSADLNPIGGIAKTDLKAFMSWAAIVFHVPVLTEIAGAPPTAELVPVDDKDAEHSQLDEEEMGMSYQELGWFGRLRKGLRCGPVSMFQKLVQVWPHLSPLEVAAKVKRFFFYYSINRHKMTTITPAYHAEDYSPDDNRFDLRQFLYPSRWNRQFEVIDKEAEARMAKFVKVGAAGATGAGAGAGAGSSLASGVSPLPHGIVGARPPFVDFKCDDYSAAAADVLGPRAVAAPDADAATSAPKKRRAAL